jgi:hypothetical protein
VRKLDLNEEDEEDEAGRELRTSERKKLEKEAEKLA